MKMLNPNVSLIRSAPAMLYEVVTGFPIFRKHCDMTFVPKCSDKPARIPFSYFNSGASEIPIRSLTTVRTRTLPATRTARSAESARESCRLW